METFNAADSERLGEPLYGVRGWLLLFCILATVLTPLRLFYAAIEQSSTAIATVHIGHAVFSFLVGLSLWLVRQRALGLLKAYFLLLLSVGTLAMFGIAYELSAGHHSIAEPQSADNLASAVQPFIFVIIWWSYFRKSQRVRLTFGTNI